MLKDHFIRVPDRRSDFLQDIIDADGDDFELCSVSIGEEWFLSDNETSKMVMDPFDGAQVASVRFLALPLSIKDYIHLQTRKEARDHARMAQARKEAIERGEEVEATMDESADAKLSMYDSEEESSQMSDGEMEDENERGPTERMSLTLQTEMPEKDKCLALRDVCEEYKSVSTVEDARQIFRKILVNGLLYPQVVDNSIDAITDGTDLGINDLMYFFRYPIKVRMDIPKDAPAIQKVYTIDGSLFLDLQAAATDSTKFLTFSGPDTGLIYRAYVMTETETMYTAEAMVPLMTPSEDVAFSPYYDDGAIHHRVSLSYQDIWNGHQRQSVVEGVAIVDGVVHPDFAEGLNQQVNDLCARHARQDRVDYHPYSNDTVLDIVHPALFGYVKGKTELRADPQDVPPCIFPALFENLLIDAQQYGYTMEEEEEEDWRIDDDTGRAQRSVPTNPKDFWGRPYEDSVHQWLPTYVSVDAGGHCRFDHYINNLVPRDEHSDLYDSLSRLLEASLPFLESVYSYVCSVRRHVRVQTDFEPDWRTSLDPHIPFHRVSFRNQKIQVIPKIVDYEISSSSSYDGVWHVEGMSHEEIVATALYILDRDDTVDGGELEFQRSFFTDEAEYLFSSVSQIRHPCLEEMIRNGLLPLGTVETAKGRLIVFPNSHVHRVKTLLSSSAGQTGRRRIVVFFLVNPLKRIVSTREVAPQQEYAGGTMSMEEAKENRLKLMEERKYTKQDWNVREIELCEH